MDNQLTTAVIAAGSALSGVALSQALTLLHGHLERRHKRQLLLREKYEILADHLDRSLEASLMPLGNGTHSFDGDAPSSARKIYTLSLLYFAKLRPQAEDYLTACINFENAASRAENRQKAMLEAAKQLGKSRTALDNRLIECARVYIR